jgi:hypothetical protein
MPSCRGMDGLSIRLFVAALLATGSAAAGAGCCCMGLHPGYGSGCGLGPARMACGGEASCVNPSDAVAGMAEDIPDFAYAPGDVCTACGPAPRARTAFRHALPDIGWKLRNLLTCGSGCGEVYIDEWKSDPPDLVDPCIDYGASMALCGCSTAPCAPCCTRAGGYPCGACESCTDSSAPIDVSSEYGDSADAVVDDSQYADEEDVGVLQDSQDRPVQGPVTDRFTTPSIGPTGVSVPYGRRTFPTRARRAFAAGRTGAFSP